ncbi:hypothetical protein QTO34_019506 [Cnephaeus nilssonii]|uniref:Uncharacterized protein n=1 Tax=Cnephaeus nilssonii TaxID=3371016 RepID=A0AA40HXV3_CNENI|nr:hypothetical protein QTO34_019506 [Eptesicus nilssonii]
MSAGLPSVEGLEDTLTRSGGRCRVVAASVRRDSHYPWANYELRIESQPATYEGPKQDPRQSGILMHEPRSKDWLGLNLGVDVTGQDPLGHCHHHANRSRIKGNECWVEWIKYFVCVLNKSDCYACTAGRPEAQVVPFPFGWTSDSNGMEYVLDLYQEETAWGNASCKTLARLFPFNRGKEQGPPKMIWPLSSNVKYTSCLSRGGTVLGVYWKFIRMRKWPSLPRSQSCCTVDIQC